MFVENVLNQGKILACRKVFWAWKYKRSKSSENKVWTWTWIKLNLNFFSDENKNTLTVPANCKKTTRHHAHLSLCAKSKKTNNAKSRKWPKTSIWVFFLWFLGQISPKLQIFLKNRFHSNWRSYLVLTSGQKPKKSLEPFLRKISKCLILG